MLSDLLWIRWRSLCLSHRHGAHQMLLTYKHQISWPSNNWYLRFIARATVAREACVMLELEAKHVKVESTSRRWTGPTTNEDVTTSAFSLTTLSPRTRTGRGASAASIMLLNGLSDWTWRPLESQWRLGLGRPTRKNQKPILRYQSNPLFSYSAKWTVTHLEKCNDHCVFFKDIQRPQFSPYTTTQKCAARPLIIKVNWTHMCVGFWNQAWKKRKNTAFADNWLVECLPVRSRKRNEMLFFWPSNALFFF